MMRKKILKLMALAPFLMAFQCEDDILAEDELVYNQYQATVSSGATFSPNDTLWITARVSSKAFNLTTNDSVFATEPPSDVFSIYKFIQPTQVSNCVDAIDQFELTFARGEYSFLPACENAEIQVSPIIANDSLSYSYRLGLRPLTTGDYVISWQDGIIQNADRNEFIVARYPIENHPGQIGFNSCGNVSWRFLDESDKEYYFSVE